MPEITKTTKQNNKLVYAGFIKRTAAVCIDYSILPAVLFIEMISWVTHHHEEPMLRIEGEYSEPSIFTSPEVIMPILLILVYYFIFEVKSNATLGKRLLGLEVVNAEGKSLTLKNKLWRFLFVVIFVLSVYIVFLNGGDELKCIHFFCLIVGVLCLFSYLSLLISPKKQTIYDKFTDCYIQDKKNVVFLLTPILLILCSLLWGMYLFYLLGPLINSLMLLVRS